MTIIEKPILNFSQRIKSAFKSQSFLQWFLAAFLIFASVLHKDYIKGIILITFAISYIFILTYLAYRMAKIYIWKIDVSDTGLIISYLMKNRQLAINLTTDQSQFRTIDESRYTFKQLQILNDGKTILKQYAFGPWNEKEIEEVEAELKRNGIKKPFGENL